MRTYVVEVANMWYETNRLARRGLGTFVGRWTTSREVVCGAELDD